MSLRQMSTSPGKINYRDSFLWFIIALPSVMLIISNILFSFYPILDLILFVFLLVFLVFWLIIICFRAALSLLHKLPKKTTSFALSLICLWPTYLAVEFFPIGDYVHLAVMYPEYNKKLASSRKTRLKFDWGTFGLLTGGIRTLIYDPNDKLPQENRLKDVELRQKTCRYKGDTCWALSTKHLIGHFYIVTEWH
jgi:hypothetical protein